MQDTAKIDGCSAILAKIGVERSILVIAGDGKISIGSVIQCSGSSGDNFAVRLERGAVGYVEIGSTEIGSNLSAGAKGGIKSAVG